MRVSGSALAEFSESLGGKKPQARFATLTTFKAADGQAIDQGIQLYFPAPHSFTGEDVLELQGHGGPVVMQLLLQRCSELGARLAEPGEFSHRAVLNDKLDLAQAEAVADLIEATTAPIRSASVQFRSSTYLATGAVITAVSNTPIVASTIEGAITALMFWKRVRRPPSNRISASATDPTR